MTYKSELLSRIEQFVIEAGISESTFGFRAVNDGKFVKRLRQGRRMYRDTEERVLEYIAHNSRSNPTPTQHQKENRV